MAKKSASDSLEKLSKGLMRETPATRAQVERVGPRETAGNGGEVARKTTTAAVTQEHSRKTGRPRTKARKMVRVSVDLPRPDHKYLRDYAYEAESDGMSVMRALLEEMRDDPELAERIQDRLAEG